MYEVSESEIEEYKRKWLEAERNLALLGLEIKSGSSQHEPVLPPEKTEDCELVATTKGVL